MDVGEFVVDDVPDEGDVDGDLVVTGAFPDRDGRAATTGVNTTTNARMITTAQTPAMIHSAVPAR